MLKAIVDKKTDINDIMKTHGAEGWKIFEEDSNIDFPTSADAHILIIRGDKVDLTRMRHIQKQIGSLFPNAYFEFYTPDDLDVLVDNKKLNPTVRDQIVSNYYVPS